MEEKRENPIEFDLQYQYEDSAYSALKEAEGVIQRGTCVVLCGASGCGKSTLLRCVNQLIPQFYEGERKGFCRLFGRDTEQLTIGEAGSLAASVFQDPRSQFFTLNSQTEVAFGLENFGMSHDEMVKRVEEAFSTFGLERLKNRNVFELSGGERQLIAILAAWALNTDLFLLDEPTANLDDDAVERLKEMLNELKKQGKTMLISEHRLYYLRDLADEFWLMERGRIVRKYKREELLALSLEELRELGLRTTDLALVEQEHFSCPPPAACHTLLAENIRFSYGKANCRVLEQVSLEMKSGEIIGLTGKNGCGKTTFGKLTAGLFKPKAGQFYLDGKPVHAKKLVQNVMFVMQEAEFQFFTNSVMNELTYGRRLKEKEKEELNALLKSCGLWKCRNQHPFSLSGGQMQKLVLLLAYCSEKPFVILDEPTAGLDSRSLISCGALIRKMAEKKGVLIITHDLELMAQVCTRCIGLSAGCVQAEFDLKETGGFDRLRKFMEEKRKPQDTRPAIREKKRPLLDPRTKMLLFLLAMAVGVWTDIPLMICCFVSVLAAVLYERRWGVLFSSLAAMGAVFLCYWLISGATGAFILYFFPKIVLIGASVTLLLQKNEAARSLAALRSMRVPERILMILSVVARFFPVLNKDLGMMHQSIRTRGFFPKWTDKLRAVPQYAELLIVPMMFRVMRIAEALSASAETRGIALKTKRESYVSVRLRPIDIFVMILAAAMVAAGLFI